MNPAWRLLKSWLVIHGALLCCATLFLQPGATAGEFIRGDANLDLQVDLSDAVLTLKWLFATGEPLPCPDAGDSDDSGVLDISDPIRTLSFLFTGGASPPLPFPDKGFDPSADGLICVPTMDFNPSRPLEAQEVLDALAEEPPTLMSFRGINSGISVSPQLFDLLASLPEGARLVDYTDEGGVAGLIEALGDPQSPAERKAATENEAPGPRNGTGFEPNCRWLVTTRILPTTQAVVTHGAEYNDQGDRTQLISSRTVRVGVGTSTTPLAFFDATTGKGPIHRLVVSRRSPNCQTPQTNMKTSGTGGVYLNMNVVCFSGDDLQITAPECNSHIHLGGSYHGLASISTWAGKTCHGQFNAVEALAQEEVALEANGMPLFTKAVGLHNGNQIQKKISFQIGTAGLSLGSSQTVSGQTGHRRVELKSSGQKRLEILPMYARLEVSGKAELFATGAADGQAMSSMRSTGLYTFGASTCAGSCAVFIAGGFESQTAEVFTAAKSFYFLQTGNPNSFQELFPANQ